jgi:hypothetical protein
VLSGNVLEARDILAVRPLGAPIVFAQLPDRYQVWCQGADRPTCRENIAPRELPEFFDRRRVEFSPEAIYRAKAWGRLDQAYQLDFVDAGLWPLIEKESGRKLTELVERSVFGIKESLGWQKVTLADGQWLLKSSFWLLAAKILKDKGVRGFSQLSLAELDTVYARLAKHYSSRAVQVGNRARRDALTVAAEQIQAFPHCGSVSTEALGYVYESALIDRTTRQKLGTHSTPSWLVEYIVGRLRPWINEISVGERCVFEPACGHAAFLISAMRLLSELLPKNHPQTRREYLRQRLHGLELDSFALEIARLSLTLADVPNPNGWALTEADMFTSGELEKGVADANIVLGNPPFENFPTSARRRGWLSNKAAETFRRVVEHLPQGGVFGFVLPQTFLNSTQAVSVREALARDYEIAEISLFADKVFERGEPESVVLIGRRQRHPDKGLPLRYQRIREGQIGEFSKTYVPGSYVELPQNRLGAPPNASFLIPDLDQVWAALSGLPHFERFAHIAKGFDHKSREDITLPDWVIADWLSVPESECPQFTEADWIPLKEVELVRGFARWDKQQLTHQLPPAFRLCLIAETIATARSGTDIGISQLLLNYGRVSREAWRLKALIDEEGHPVTSRFLVVRPYGAISLNVLWAVCNSPVANAYAYCTSGKRDVLAGDMRRMPVPDFAGADLAGLERAVSRYLSAARNFKGTVQQRPSVRGTGQQQPGLFDDQSPKTTTAQPRESELEQLKFLHWRIDAEVLRLYSLPANLERQVLDLFTGVRRRGVPFEQSEYFPKDFTDLQRLSDLLAITGEWAATNLRRAELMDCEADLSKAEAAELDRLQFLADARVNLVKPDEGGRLGDVIEDLKRRGLWKE